jgi:serine/threonine protein kinase
MQFVGKVGEGTFKQTFEVICEDGTRRALKIFKIGTSPERNKRELQAMLRCNHPNIAKLHSVGPFKYGAHTVLTTLEEFLPGGPFPSSVDRTRCLIYGSQLIDALSHLAKAGLVHRDLKPDNILFRDKAETPVIVDFGIVRDLAETSITPTWLPHGPGTPLFSSPEQLNNEKHLLDWRSDQFSLGVVLSIACLGTHPYADNDNPHDSITVTRSASRQGPSEMFKKRADACLPALARMVSPWPVQRFRTAILLAEAWDHQKGAH